MKANKITSLLVATGLTAAASTSLQAADVPMSFSFQTVPDVTISLVQNLSFGNDFTLAVSSTCSMLVSSASTERPGSVAARIGTATAWAAGTSYQAKSGNCDTANPGTAGIYKIAGAKGVDVDVTVNAIPAGGVDFSFIPEGCVVSYDGSADGDNCFDLTANGNNREYTATLAADADTIGNTSGSPIAGEALLYVGGEITAQNTLTAGTTYTQQFTIDVTY